MQERIITIYCLCDEFLKATDFVEHPGTTMNTAEVMTTALVAADIFGGCFERSRAFLAAHGYIPQMLSKSRFNRRLHALPESLWLVRDRRWGMAAKPLIHRPNLA